MPYTHLSSEERYQIHALRQSGQSLRSIGAVLGRSAATICRELSRNRGAQGYRPQEARRQAWARAVLSRSRPRITLRQWREIARLLEREWSPQQIAERRRCEGTLAISHEWIYQFV